MAAILTDVGLMITESYTAINTISAGTVTAGAVLITIFAGKGAMGLLRSAFSVLRR